MDPQKPQKPDQVESLPYPLPSSPVGNVRPLPTITVLFAGGILISAYARSLTPAIAALCCLFCILFAITRRRIWLLSGMALCFLLLGATRDIVAQIPAKDDISGLASRTITVTGVVQSDVELPLDPLSMRLPEVRCLLNTQEVDLAGTTRIPASGMIELSLPLVKGESGVTLSTRQENLPHYGDMLIAHGRLELPYGQRNPGGFDESELMDRKHISAVLVLRHPQDWQVAEPRYDVSPFRGLALALRQGVIQRLRSGLSRENSAVMEGLLLGMRDDLPDDLNDVFERTGMSHLLATAGLHIGLIATLLAFTLRLIGLPRRPSFLAIAALLILYSAVASGRPSIVRAVIVSDLFLFGLLLEREPNPANALSLAALILLLVDPKNLFDPGFQFSFAVVITILLFMPQAHDFIRQLGDRVPRQWVGAIWIRRVIQFPVACCFAAAIAQVGAAPLIAYHYNLLSLIALPANALLVPPLGLLIGSGFIAVTLDTLHLPFAGLFYHLLDRLLAPLISLARAFAAPTWADVSVISPPLWFIIGYYSVVWVLAWRWLAERRQNEKMKPK